MSTKLTVWWRWKWKIQSAFLNFTQGEAELSPSRPGNFTPGETVSCAHQTEVSVGPKTHPDVSIKINVTRLRKTKPLFLLCRCTDSVIFVAFFSNEVSMLCTPQCFRSYRRLHVHPANCQLQQQLSSMTYVACHSYHRARGWVGCRQQPKVHHRQAPKAQSNRQNSKAHYSRECKTRNNLFH